jgi:ribonuclease HI
MYMINTDASIEPFNPGGLGAWAFIVKKMSKIIHQDVAITGWGNKITNNVMEYNAVVAAFKWLISLPKEDRMPVTILSDSKLIVNQCLEQWNCNDEKLKPKLELILKAKKAYGKTVFFKWIPREKNTEADALSRTLYTKKAIDLLKERELDIFFEGDDLSW